MTGRETKSPHAPVWLATPLWREYRAERVAAEGARGSRAVAYERNELRAGRLRVLLLRSKDEVPAGFVLHPPRARVGLQAETIYLRRGLRSPSALRGQLRRLLEQGPVLSVTGSVLGISSATMTTVLGEFGFRRVDRRRLWIDPRRVRPPSLPVPRLSLRRLRRSDEPRIARLIARAYAHHIDAAFGPGGDAAVWGPDYVHGVFASERYPLDFGASFVVEGARGLDGAVLVVARGRTPRVQGLSVEPKARGRGIGSCLLRRALAELAERGTRRADLGVTAQNPTGAYSLYRRLGFRPARRDPRYRALWVHEATRRKWGLRVLGEPGP
jgi:ribosomal protein S18 acetylase RimI-like enzyme